MGVTITQIIKGLQAWRIPGMREALVEPVCGVSTESDTARQLQQQQLETGAQLTVRQADAK